jgi:3-oxoacyl-[acyl-carrier-protein] synthase III
MSRPIRVRPGAPHARMIGIGTYRPSRIVTNEELCRTLDSSDEWIQSRSGIRNRRFADAGETLLEMCVAAAGKALAHSGITSDQVGCTLVATVTHPEQIPQLAPQVAHRLGSVGVAFDIAAACSGFCCALALASDMVRAGSAEYVLVIGAERMSDFLDVTDRSTGFLFGDGAGAVVVGPSDTPGIGPVVWGSDGSQSELIRMSHPWETIRTGGDTSWPVVRVEGQEVFRWASFQVAPVARKALEQAEIEPRDLDAFVPHQANLRIIEAMARVLTLPPNVAIGRDIVESGNTVAATIPLAMEALLESGAARPGGLALLIGFGSGLIYAAQVVTLPKP